MLSNLTSSFSGSTELNKIFNQLGITVSDETLHRYITEVVTLLNEDNMKSSFVSNGFTVTSIDNVDKGSPHASLSFGNTKYGLHGTSVQALQPKPHSIKNSPQDYVMFHRQPTEEEETVQNLFPIRVYPDGRCLFRSVASWLEQCLLICPRNNAGAPVDPTLFELEKNLADLLRESTVNVLKSNLPFFHQLDDAVLHTLCEKESGSFYDSFSDRLEWMLKCDEFAGVPEILGIVYGSNCPIYIYNESNGEFVCGMKYGDDTFPNVEPIRLLYSSDTPSSPGHYDLLVNQHTISNTHTVIDAATDPQGFFDSWRNLCRICSYQDKEPDFNRVFIDRSGRTVSATTDHDDIRTKPARPHGRTLAEANIDFSLPDKTDACTRVINSNPSCEFGKLNLNDFAVTDSEKAAFDKLRIACERHDIQCTLLSKNQKANFVLPTLKKSLTIQELDRETETSNIVYLRVFKDHADNSDTIRKVLDFLSEMFKVGKNLEYLVVVGDGKTYEYLRKLKYQYRPAMNWLIPFPGDWHVCKNYQKVLMKIYWHAGLKNMAEKAGNKTKVLNSLEKCGNFQRTHNFLIQSFHAVLRCQIDAFYESLSADTDKNHLDYLQTLSSKIEKIGEEKSPGEQKSSNEQIAAFIEIQEFISDSPNGDDLHKKFNSFCDSMGEQDDTWHFWREFVTKSMLPYLGLYFSMCSEQWDLRLGSLKMMAPIFHAFDSSNYIHIIPNHIAEMLCLPPSLLDHFKNGGFVASIKGNTWSSVALDESHEMCINKDVKAAISKLSDDYISKITKSLKHFRSQLGVFSGEGNSKSTNFSSKDDESLEYNVKKLIAAIKEYDLLPPKLSKNRGLVNVFTQTSADLQQNIDMLNFRTTGETEMNAFIKSRVIGTPSTDAPVRRKNLKVFKCAKKGRKNQNHKTSDKDKKTLLACLRKTIANCKQKGTQVPDFLQFNELPRAICTSDGLPNKGQKSNALKFYQKRYDTVITCIYPPLWEPDTIILEGMFLINSSPLYGQHKTFLDYAIFLVKRWIFPHLSRTSVVKEVHVLFDHPERQGNYPKQAERLRRDGSSLLSDHHSSENSFLKINDSCHLPADWRSLLADRKSKRALVNYLSASFLSLVPKFLTDGQSFTTAGGFDGEKKDKAFTCTNLETSENISFKSNHEEADS